MAGSQEMQVEVAGERQPRFAIGQKFMSSGKYPREMTVTDIWRTYNHAGALVCIRYVAEHTIMGHKVTQYDVIETSIARRIVG